MNVIQTLMVEADVLMNGAEQVERSMSSRSTQQDIRKMCTVLGIRLAAYRLYDTIDLLANTEPEPSDDEHVPF